MANAEVQVTQTVGSDMLQRLRGRRDVLQAPAIILRVHSFGHCFRLLVRCPRDLKPVPIKPQRPYLSIDGAAPVSISTRS